MAAPVTDSPPQERTTDTPRRPTNRQWWKVAQLALELLEVPAPQTRREMSELIDRLQATATPAPDTAPF